MESCVPAHEGRSSVLFFVYYWFNVGGGSGRARSGRGRP